MKEFMTLEKGYLWGRAFDLAKIVGYSNATGDCPFARCWHDLDPDHLTYHVGTHYSTRYRKDEAAVKQAPYLFGYFDERFIHPPEIANAIYLVDKQHMNAGLPMPVTARAFCAILEEVHGGPFAGFSSVLQTPITDERYFCTVCQEYHLSGPYALAQTTVPFNPFKPPSAITIESIEAAVKGLKPNYMITSDQAANLWHYGGWKEIVTPGYTQKIEDEPTHPLPVVKELVAV